MIFGREPAFWIGVIASAVIAVLTVLSGNGLVSEDAVQTIRTAIDPTVNGWALPIIIGLITRFFVSPAAKPGL